MDLSWLATAGPYGGLVLIILWITRLLAVSDRRHEQEMRRITQAHDAELKRINADHDQELADFRADIRELRAEIAGLRVELQSERDARRIAEEQTHQFKLGRDHAPNDPPPPGGDLRRPGTGDRPSGGGNVADIRSAEGRDRPR